MSLLDEEPSNETNHLKNTKSGYIIRSGVSDKKLKTLSKPVLKNNVNQIHLSSH